MVSGLFRYLCTAAEAPSLLVILRVFQIYSVLIMASNKSLHFSQSLSLCIFMVNLFLWEVADVGVS